MIQSCQAGWGRPAGIPKAARPSGHTFSRPTCQARIKLARSMLADVAGVGQEEKGCSPLLGVLQRPWRRMRRRLQAQPGIPARDQQRDPIP